MVASLFDNVAKSVMPALDFLGSAFREIVGVMTAVLLPPIKAIAKIAKLAAKVLSTIWDVLAEVYEGIASAVLPVLKLVGKVVGTVLKTIGELAAAVMPLV